MTTIASDGITVAADTQTTCMDLRTSGQKQKLIVRDHYVFAIAGDTSAFEPLIAWYLAGADVNAWPNLGKLTFSFGVFFGDVALCWDDGSAYHCAHEYPTAFGSGQNIARGVLHMGHTPREAVQAAIDLEINTGGTPQVVYVPEFKSTTHHPPKPVKKTRKTKRGSRALRRR